MYCSVCVKKNLFGIFFMFAVKIHKVEPLMALVYMMISDETSIINIASEKLQIAIYGALIAYLRLVCEVNICLSSFLLENAIKEPSWGLH